MSLHTPPPAPYAADIRAMLERVAGSATFRSSPQLVAFLRLIVDMTLKGEADRIKAYTIGTDALGRDQDFDPQRDPIVRVEANRLRRALAAYYAEAGADDPIIVDVPPGRYVPSFRLRVGDDVPAHEPPAPPQSGWLRRLLLPGAAGFALALIMALAAAEALLTGSRTAETDPPGLHPAVIDGAPVVVIEPIRALPASATPLAADLDRELANTFGQVQTITVVAGAAAADRPAAEAAATRPYRLAGLVEARPDGSANAALQLVANGVIEWAREWQMAPGDRTGIERISRDTATEVVGWFGVVHARVRTEANRLAPGFRCLLATADYLQKFDLRQHERVRDCLEHGAAADSRSAITFAALALIYDREYLLDLPSHPGDPPALERMDRAARRALAIDPNSVLGHLAMMEDQYARGDLPAAFAAAEAALALNPFDPAASGLVGLRLALGGQIERGAALMAKAAARLSVNPTWLDFGLFCVAYLKGDMTRAAHYASFQAGGTYPYGMAARALVAAAAGERDRARRALVRLTMLYPGWSEPRPMLARLIRSPAIVDRLAHDIAAIGAE